MSGFAFQGFAALLSGVAKPVSSGLSKVINDRVATALSLSPACLLSG